MTAFPITIKPELVEICEGDHCAAAILDLFTRWTVGKDKRGQSPWIYKKRTEMRDDLLGMFGLNRVAGALIKLRAWHYLQHRQNPHNGQDKVLQYRLDQNAVAEALSVLGYPSEADKESVERLNLNAEKPDSTLSLTESLSESLSDHVTEPTPTPARARVPTGFPAVTHEMGDGVQPAIPEADEVQDEHEPYTLLPRTPATATAQYAPPVPPRPPSDDDTEPDAEASTSDVPEWVGIFTARDWEIDQWLATDYDRLRAWCEYAPDHGLGGGFVRLRMREKQWPPRSVAPATVTSSSYITGALADFIHH